MGCVCSSLASRLREASNEGNLEEVRRLLVQEGAVAVINDADEQGATALLFATGWMTVKKSYETAYVISNKGALISARVKPLHTTSTDLAFSQFPDNTQLVQLLLQHGAQVNQKTRWSRVTPLTCAACIGNASVVRALLSAGANIMAVDYEGGTALHEAARFGHTEVMSMLLDAGANIDARDNGITSLICASSWGRSEVVSILLAAGADTEAKSTDGDTALIQAACNGHAGVVRLLLAARTDFETRRPNGDTALILAVCNGHTEVVRLLLTVGADIETRRPNGDTALMQAACNGHVKLVSMLLAAGADIEVRGPNGDTALIQAACNGRAKVVSILLAAEADIKSRGPNADTALIYAACNGHARAVSVLLAAGADIEARGPNGDTALIQAACNGCAKVVSILLAAGADIEARGPNGDTALIYAAYFGHAQIVRDLISAAAEVNTKNNDGYTALILAMKENHPHIADDILTYGKNVDVDALTSHGHTARDWAGLKGYEGLFRKLNVAALNFVPVPVRVTQNLSKKTSETQPTSSPTTSILSALPTRYLPSAPMSCSRTVPSTTPSPVAPAVDRKHRGEDVGKTQPTSSPTTSILSALPTRYLPSAPMSCSRTVPPTTPPLVAAAVDRNHRRVSFHSSWLIPYSDLQLGAALGRGSFAKVYNASWQETDVAVKVFDLPDGPEEGTSAEFSASLLAKISAEADLLASIRHPNVVAFLGMCQEPPCVVTENCSRGSLFDILRKAKAAPADAALLMDLSWARRLSMAVDAATGMLHLHQRSPPVMHRDFKSPNLLVKDNWKVKVSDLGLSKLVEEVNAATSAGSTAGQLNPRWMAPEVVEGGRPSLPSDVYAFGVVLWELLTWEIPWSHVANPIAIFGCVMRGDSLPIPKEGAIPGPTPLHNNTLKEYTALIKECMAVSPEQRPQFSAVVQRLKALVVQEGGIAEGILPRARVDAGGAAYSSAVCVVCMEQPSTAGLVHRSSQMVHRCCCETCAELLRSRSDPCPMCRRPIDEVLLHFH